MTKGRFLPLAAALAISSGVGLAVSAFRAPVHVDEVWDNRRIDPLFADGAGTRAVVVIENGSVVAKKYAPGFSDDTRFISWSMAKTITAMLVGELVADGRLALDAPAPVPAWRRPGDPRAAITLRQLLTMSSGLTHTEVGDPVQDSDTNQVLFVSGTRDMAAAAVAQPLEAAPGARFEYSSLTTIILSDIVARTLTASTDPRVRAQAYRAFADERLFAPAGIRSARFEFDGAGTQVGGSLIYMTLDDWGRFGRVLLDGRGQAATAIVQPDWLAFMKTPAATNGQYGGQTWLNRPGQDDPALFPDKGLPQVAAAIGHLGQYVVTGALPDDRNLVVVRLGHTPDDARRATVDRIGDLFVAFAKETDG